MDTCSAESHTGRRGSHLNTNQTGLSNTRRGRNDRYRESERERLQALVRELETVN